MEPADVVGLTFTRKAAAELSTRVRSLLDNLYEDYPRGEVASGNQAVRSSPPTTRSRISSWLSTVCGLAWSQVHVCCPRPRHCNSRTGWCSTRSTPSRYRVAPSNARADRCQPDQQLSEHIASPEELREHDRRLVDRVAGLEKSVALDRAAADAAQQRIQVSELVEEFRREKQAEDVIDFADVMRFGHELASRDDVQSLVHDQVRMVLLDEYQDTSVVQAELTCAAGRPGASVTAVGDPLQAIYSWRGAGANAMADFESHFTAAGTSASPFCH